MVPASRNLLRHGPALSFSLCASSTCRTAWLCPERIPVPSVQTVWLRTHISPEHRPPLVHRPLMGWVFGLLGCSGFEPPRHVRRPLDYSPDATLLAPAPADAQLRALVPGGVHAACLPHLTGFWAEMPRHMPVYPCPVYLFPAPAAGRKRRFCGHTAAMHCT